MQIEVDLIRPARSPIRQTLDEEKLKQLEMSVEEKGVLQPIKVRPVPNDGTTIYEIVYGARRWHACQMLGLGLIPAIVEELSDSEAEEQSIIENVQREDMPELELAIALKSHMRKFNKSYSDIARMIGVGEARTKAILQLANNQEIAKEFYNVNNITDRHLSDDLGNVSQSMPKDVSTKVKYITEATKDKDLQKEIAKKVVREDLSQQKTRQVAQSVKVAPTSEAKAKLIDWEYSSTIHDPELIKSRAESHGAHDKLYQDEKPSPQEDWDKAPEVKMLTEGLKMTLKLIGEIRKTNKIIGKLAPEAKQFMVTKLRSLIDKINDLLTELED